MNGLQNNDGPISLAFTLQEASRVARIGTTSLRKAINEDRLVARKIGKRVVILHDDLQAYLKAQPKVRAAAA